MFFFLRGEKERMKERKKKRSVSFLWLEDLSVLVDWFFLKYLFSPRKINFAKKDKTKSRIEKTPTEKAKNHPSLKALGVVNKSFGIIISSFALRKPRSNGHSASFARTTARKTARRNLRVVPKRAAFFGSIVAPARTDGTTNVALEEEERDHSSMHHRTPTFFKKQKKKAVGKIDVSKSSPRRCDATRRTWTLVALRPATDAICWVAANMMFSRCVVS